jgi:hypothetical protein
VKRLVSSCFGAWSQFYGCERSTFGFLATLVSTTMTGVITMKIDPVHACEALLFALPFAIFVLAILAWFA